LIAKVLEALAEAGWDAEKAAPYPRSTKMGQLEYIAKRQKYQLFRNFTANDDKKNSYRHMGDPEFRIQSDRLEERFIKNAREDAAAQYDMFVAKLVKKIGHCDTATLTGNHVWGWSFLTVTKGSDKEVWKTQQIVNQSKLGKLFNQWPSRKVKN
jgi:hypothetical protein